MARGKNVEDSTTLEMAIVGYQLEKEKIETKIRDLQSQLKGKRSAQSSGAADKKGEREESSQSRSPPAYRGSPEKTLGGASQARSGRS